MTLLRNLSNEDKTTINEYLTLPLPLREKVSAYIDGLLAANTDGETVVIVDHPLPYAAAGGDVTNLEEARRRFDEAIEKTNDDG